LLEAHEDRIQKVENGLSAMNNQVLPGLARLEQIVVHGFEAIHNRLDYGDLRFTRIEDGIKEVEQIQTQSGSRVSEQQDTIDDLKKDMDDRAESKKAIKRWVLGAIGTVVTTAVIAWLGLG
jgi:uncharacterized protein YdcH (DUF465 family)